MKLSYDAATDTPLILRDAPARITEEEKSGVVLDYDGVDTVQLQVIPKPGARQPAAAG